MNTTGVSKPNPASVLAGLKDFQRRTVDYAFRRLYTDADSTHRFLVADEVGLGKTLVARGVIAKAVEHLWDKVKRIDVVYVCSNTEIARQNINRLRLEDTEFAHATRATMLGVQLGTMSKQRVNFVSMTPGTSLDPTGGTGVAKERAFLFHLLEDHWKLPKTAATNVLRAGKGAEGFRQLVNEFLAPGYHNYTIDENVQASFIAAVDASESQPAGCLRNRFLALCDEFKRSDTRVSEETRIERRQVIAQLRALLAQVSLRTLQPDLVILDEFQRFKHLLDPENPEAELAQELLNYAEDAAGGGERVRVLLLSATPYKMYTLQHEKDRGDDDHYKDFVATYDFLVRHGRADIAALENLLARYRAEMFQLGDGTFTELRRIKAELEQRLRRVMARTERLAVTNDRSGMLRECESAVRLEDADVRQYLAVSKVAAALDQGDIVEYWKSAPYLLNFMDEYQLKKGLRASVDNGTGHEVAKALAPADAGLLQWEDVQAYRRIDPANARLRALLGDTVEKGLWRLLWLPPSLPYYRLSGAFEGIDPVAATKRLVFSSWKVVPKVIAAVLSHEAERRAIGQMHSEADGSISIVNSTEGRKKIATLLRFTRAGERLTGMPVLGLVYPSVSMARAFDPAVAHDIRPTRDETLDRARAALEPLVDAITARWRRAGEVDEQWYWAAPILMDLIRDPEGTRRFWERRKLAAEWSGEEDSVDADGELETESAWADHVELARALIRNASVSGKRPLGAPPPDLLDMLAKSSLGNPAIVALRALTRVTGAEALTDDGVRLAAGRIAWRTRNLFNLPEVISLVRGLGRQEPYWLRVIEYAVDGCLQAVLDEYAHVLRDSLGVTSLSPADAAGQIGEAMSAAVGPRSAAVGVDEIRAQGRSLRLTIEPRRMRARFAARFGQEQTEKDGEATRADQVRAAFNSPFWPFVLASTSVGQEGLDFHHYCHAIVHWNLPSNPVDLEQREGRIHRYKGHAVRKNVALKHGNESIVPFTDPWEAAFLKAAADRNADTSELVPFWVFPHVGGAVIERYMPMLPLSRDTDRLTNLRGALALYRMVFGQPRQDELVKYLLATLPQRAVDQIVKELRIDLEPPSHVP